MTQVSFVVDGLARHYYQAELLLLSVETFGLVPRQNILVQCTTRVDAAFLRFLDESGYRRRIIEPFLDGKYCNKLRQLDAFAGQAVDGVFLLDADMFVLEPLRPPQGEVFCAKVVEHPNPSLSVLQRIFAAAQIPAPREVPTDATVVGNTTLDGNFNGGYYYVPGQYVAPVHDEWTRWASWLFERPELFDNRDYAIHTDQVAMAMALASGGIPFRPITSNANYPLHLPDELRYFEAGQPVQVLHYHWLLSNFGLIDGKAIREPIILAAIEKANLAITHQRDSLQFYAGYRRSLVRPPADTALASVFAETLRHLVAGHGQPIKLILHAGTPKTGTTSQQFMMADNGAELAQAGYLYPANYTRSTFVPKHQWLVSALLAGDLTELGRRFEEVFNELSATTHTIVLSTEGIYNHWFDFGELGRAALATLASLFNVSLWVWFRSPLDFMNSYYQQNLKNPQMDLVASYGRDQSLAELLNDPWFVGHLDYLGFILECEAIFGAGNMRPFNYESDTVAQMAQALGVAFRPSQRLRDNTGLSAAAIQMLRIANRYPLLHADKRAVVAGLRAIDAVLGRYGDKVVDDPVAAARIQTLTALQSAVLRRDYGVTTT